MEKEKKFSIGTYLKRHAWGIFLYIFLLAVMTALQIFSTILVADAIEMGTNKMLEPAIRGMINVFALTVLIIAVVYLMDFIYFKVSTDIVSELNLDLAKQAFKLNSRTYTDHGTGVFVSRIINDPQGIIDKLVGIVDRLANVIKALFMTIYISLLNIWIGLIMIATMIVGAVIEAFKIKKFRKNSKQVKKLGDKINSLTTEIVRSEKDIKSLGLEERLAKISGESYREYRNADKNRWMTNVSFGISRNFVIEVVSVIVLILGIVLMNKGAIALAAFLIIYRQNGQLMNLIWGLGRILEDITNIKIASERMGQLFDEDEFVTEKFGTKSIKKVKGYIEFKNVSFTFKDYEYPTLEEELKAKKKKQKAEKKLIGENKIFEDLSFKIQPNTTVAFVGKSGSGKSTILNLMSKMIECDAGQVLIDNVDIKELNKETLRSAVSLVNQFPYIFDMSIKENLLLAKPDATDKQIKDAIKKASLEEFVNTLPNGVDTMVGESGIKLSGGQKQRLAIARALLRKSNIIIFDESTSSLDNFAQEEVKKSIEGLKGSSTIVIVAHRLSTIKNADTIFFLDNGKIVDGGTFDELFKRNKTFKTMFLAENI